MSVCVAELTVKSAILRNTNVLSVEKILPFVANTVIIKPNARAPSNLTLYLNTKLLSEII